MEGLQNLLTIAYNYSRKWRFVFNPAKCAVVQFGDIRKKNVRPKVGKDSIEIVKKDIHLGVVLTDKEECIKEMIDDRIQGCKNIGYAIQGLGSHVTPVTPVTGSKVYWAVCIPKLCYGTELMDIKENVVNSMDMYHCKMAKHQQNLPSQSNNPGSLATLGWKSIKAHCNFLKLIFLWQLLLLPFDCVYKEICIKRLCLLFYKGAIHQGPLYNILNVCKEYGISEIVRASLESGVYMQKQVWKSVIKKKLMSLENKRWSTICKMYKTLHFLSGDIYKMSTWWIHAYHDHCFAKQNRIVIRLLLNVFMYTEKMCPGCDLNIVNNVVMFTRRV